MKNKIILLSLISASVLAGCTKEGPAGPAGANGNANVSSEGFSVSTWTWSGSYYYYADLDVPELTSSNINSAAVMVYFSTGGSWVALPYTQYHSPHNYVMGFNTSAGQVEVTWFYDTSLSAGDDPNTYYATTVQCKVVVIPRSIMHLHPDLDIKNYEQVKNTFGLQD